MTHLSFPQTGGPLGNDTEGLTHVDFVGTPFPEYSAGFLAAPGIYDEGPFQVCFLASLYAPSVSYRHRASEPMDILL